MRVKIIQGKAFSYHLNTLSDELISVSLFGGWSFSQNNSFRKDRWCCHLEKLIWWISITFIFHKVSWTVRSHFQMDNWAENIYKRFSKNIGSTIIYKIITNNLQMITLASWRNEHLTFKTKKLNFYGSLPMIKNHSNLIEIKHK